MSRIFPSALIGAAAALGLAMLASPASAAPPNPGASLPPPAHGTAGFLNLPGGAHFELGFSALIGSFYIPTNAAALAIAPFGLSLSGTPLPDPNATSSSASGFPPTGTPSPNPVPLPPPPPKGGKVIPLQPGSAPVGP